MIDSKTVSEKNCRGEEWGEEARVSEKGRELIF
jgi:hypothetical protein